MKIQSVLTVAALTLSVISQAALVTPNLRMPRIKKHPLVIVKDAQMGNYFSGALPEGFSDELLKQKPSLSRNFLSYLAKLEREKRVQWKQYVLEDDGEFGDLSEKERAAKAKDPHGELGTRYLVEIGDVYAIYQNGGHVGYVFETADHVQAAIYQDGAGIIIYTDTNLNVVTTDEWSS
jgi:hypothetical protein